MYIEFCDYPGSSTLTSEWSSYSRTALLVAYGPGQLLAMSLEKLLLTSLDLPCTACLEIAQGCLHEEQDGT